MVFRRRGYLHEIGKARNQVIFLKIEKLRLFNEDVQ